MKAYNVHGECILIENKEIIYFIWNAPLPNLIIVDKLKLNPVTFLKTIYNAEEKEQPPLKINQLNRIKEHYQMREKYPTINLNQYLTHKSLPIREMVKQILEDSKKSND